MTPGGSATRVVRTAVRYLLVFVAGFLFFSFVSFWLAVRPPRLTVPIGLGDYGLRAEEITFAADDGVRLSAWLIPQPGAPAVILLHGYPAERSDMLPIAATLHPRFTTLVVDLRYFGKSGGRVTTLGARERGDLKRAIDFLAGRGFPAVGVFGFSLGGAVALVTAAEDPRIRAVAAYGMFSDLRVLGRELYGWLWVLKYPLVELMVLWGRLFLGVDLTSPAPVAAARGLATPVLLIHSREDEQIPFRHAERLREALAGSRGADFHVMERGRHGQLPADFAARLTDFFARHLR